MQRLRLRFGRGEPVRFISHLDTVRCWERALRRAAVPLEYTQGFTPHPKIAVAAPLAVGVTSDDAELMDIWVRKWMPPQSAMMLLRGQLPAGFTVQDVWEVPESAPALQAMVSRARYACAAEHEGGLEAAVVAAAGFMAAESVVHRFERAEEARSVDLRPLVHSLEVQPGDGGACRVEMEVSVGQQGSARPDHVLMVLGFRLPAVSIARVALELEHPEQ